MSKERLARLVLLKSVKLSNRILGLLFKKNSTHEVCPKCACPSESVYDHRLFASRMNLFATSCLFCSSTKGGSVAAIVKSHSLNPYQKSAKAGAQPSVYGRQYAERRKTFMIFPESKDIMFAPLIQFIEPHMIVLKFAAENSFTLFRQSSALMSIPFGNQKGRQRHTRPGRTQS
jgi:hypothetical protein